MLSGLRLQLLVLIVASDTAFAEREDDGSVSWAVDAGSHFHAAAKARASSAVVSHMAALRELDDMAVSHIKAFSMDAQKIAAFQVKAQQTILDMVIFFSDIKNPLSEPDISGGVSKIAIGLFECVEMLLPDEAKKSEYFPRFKTAWMETLAEAKTVETHITKWVKLYQQDAKPKYILNIVQYCVQEALTIIERFLPAKTAGEVVNYFKTINDVTDGVVDAWQAFVDGNAVGGLESTYDAIKLGLDAVLPDEIKNNEVYSTIMETLETQISNLNDYVLSFKRKLMEAKMCWRDERVRNANFPDTCGSPAWPGYYYAGHGKCRQESSLLQLEDVARNVDAASSVKRAAPAPTPPVFKDERTALCDEDLMEPIGDKCFEQCPDGYQKTQNGKKCITTCVGNFSFAEDKDGYPDGLMCGRSPQMIQMTKVEMLTAVVSAVLNIGSLIQQCIAEGRVSAKALEGILEGAVKLAVAFVFPGCPVQETTGDGDATAGDGSDTVSGAGSREHF